MLVIVIIKIKIKKKFFFGVIDAKKIKKNQSLIPI